MDQEGEPVGNSEKPHGELEKKPLQATMVNGNVSIRQFR
jgi:hypothetical protein